MRAIVTIAASPIKYPHCLAQYSGSCPKRRLGLQYLKIQVMRRCGHRRSGYYTFYTNSALRWETGCIANGQLFCIFNSPN